MCTIIKQRQLSPDDLAVLSGRRFADYEPEEGSPSRGLAICECQPGDAFGFGPICLSQIVRPIDPRDLP